jgi:hypothetical protein
VPVSQPVKLLDGSLLTRAVTAGRSYTLTLTGRGDNRAADLTYARRGMRYELLELHAERLDNELLTGRAPEPERDAADGQRRP